MTRLHAPKLFAVLLALAACGSAAPEITNAQVVPASFTINGWGAMPMFTVSCNVMHFGGSITSVVAKNAKLNITVNLSKQGGTLGDEQWSGSTQVSAVSGLADGTYQIDFTATDSNGTSQTQTNAAQVVISG